LGIFIDDRIFGSLTGGEAQRLERGWPAGNCANWAIQLSTN
jgi:hypothetical protein